MSEDLPGSQIDVGVDPLPRKAILPTWVKAAVCFSVVLASAAVLISALLFASNRQQGNIDRQNDRQATEQAIYDIGYRICAREAVDRAYARWRDPEGAAKLEVLDCRPNLRGLPATVLTERDTADFVRRFVSGELTPAERGICRTTIKVGDNNIC